MDIDTILNKCKYGNERLLVGLFILNLLRTCYEKTNSEFNVGYVHNGYTVTAYSTNGLKIKGITPIEGAIAFLIIPYLDDSSNICDIEKIKKICNSDDKTTILLISFQEASVLNKIRDKIKNNNLFLWGKNEIQKIINANESVAVFVLNNLLKSTIDKEIKEDTNQEKSNHLSELRKLYGEGRMSLLLGAGVSCSAGLPNWNGLLNMMYIHLVKENFSHNASEIDLNQIARQFQQINNESSLYTARYLRNGISSNVNDDAFLVMVKKCLYSDGEKHSKLVQLIGKMCQETSKIRSIISYNFDDLIERYLTILGVDYESIYKIHEEPSSEKLPIYHVHGYIPKENDFDNDMTLVFSEEAYHKVYSDPYHWSNLIQLSAFKQNCCLMIGLSLNDPNLRRLLEINANNQLGGPRHYAFIKSSTLSDFKDDSGLTQGSCSSLNDPNHQKINDIQIKEKILKMHYAIQKLVLKSLGVNVIWYENHEDIPDLLEKIIS